MQFEQVNLGWPGIPASQMMEGSYEDFVMISRTCGCPQLPEPHKDGCAACQ